MAESVLLVLVVAAAAGAAGFAGYALARRFARGGRELGTEAEQVRYTTLHLATRAAEHLRGGIGAAESARAVRDR